MNNSKMTLGVFGMLALVLHVDMALAAIAGQVQFVNGDVQITDSAGRVRTMHKGDAVNEGDTIISAKAASAQIRMQDGGFIAVRADTKLKFDSFKFGGQESGKESSSDNSFFSLFKGGFRAITGLIGRVNKQNYKITTPAATIGIRGTDHETVYVPNDLPGVAAGAYSKVNVGETTLTTDAGSVGVKPNQMGYAGGLNQAPKLQPVNTNIFTVAAAPAKEAKKEKEGSKGGEQKQTAQGDKKNDKGNEPESAPKKGDPSPSSGPAEVRPSAIVDNTDATTGSATAPATSAAAPPPAAVAPPLATQGGVPVTLVDSTGNTLNATSQTLTSSSGQATTIQNGVYDVQAQAAADAALAAANAAQAAAVAANQAQTLLLAIAPVSTTAAAAATSNAANSINTANTAVTVATALVPANAATATANATAAQAAATAAATQTTAAQNAYTANGAFADTTAAPANTATQNANTPLQTANTAVQTAPGAVAAHNSALAAAQGAAATALASANTNLTTSNNSLTTANIQNAAIVPAQTSGATQLSAAQTAAAIALTAATAAQNAATLAASLQAAGDLVGAQAKLLIAQQQLALAQTGQTNAQAAQTAVGGQLSVAQNAQTAAGAAVTSAGNAAVAAATAAATASTQAAAAGTAKFNADTALIASTADLATVNANAATVAANAPVAAYNNPAVNTALGGNGGFSHLGLAIKSATKEEIISLDAAPGPQTNYVLDGNKNLVEIRHSLIDGNGYNYFIPLINDANVKLAGGVAKDTFKFADNSGYMGRWQGGNMVVTDALSPSTPQTFALGATSMHWGVFLNPALNYVQSLTGTASYTLVAATHPTDSFGNVGTLNNAYINANFITQTVNTGVNLSFSTTDATNASAKNMAFSASATGIAITGKGFDASPAGNGSLVFVCSGADCDLAGYKGDIVGQFAGADAIHAALGYAIHAVVTSPVTNQPHTDLIRGEAAFSTATAPAVGSYGPYNPSHTEILLAAPMKFSGGDGESFLVAAADMTNFPPVSNAASSFIEQPIGGDGGSQTFTALGGISPLAGTVTSFATTGIQLGRWSSVNALEFTHTHALGGSNGDAKNWLYGPQGYLDPGITASGGQMYGTFNYVLDGNTAPYDKRSGRGGVLTSASISANFVTNTFNANLALNVGGLAWSASAANVSLVNANLPAGQFSAASGSSYNLTVDMGTAAAPLTATPCPSCSGRLSGAFTGQNFAGAMLSYNLWDNGDAGGDVSGNAAFARSGSAITNGAAAVTGKYVVADHGGDIQMADTLNLTGGVLTSYSYGNSANPANGYGSTTVTGCTSCTSTAATNATSAAAPTGIYFGSWDAGTFSNTWGGGVGSASPGWITGPEAGPLFLANALTGSKTFTFDGGMVTNGNGVAGTVLGTTALTVDFTKQVVGINIDLSINDTATTPAPALHTWNAKTLPGNEAPINGGKGIGGAAFQASSYSNNAGPGLLTVTVDGSAPGSGNVSGQLTGAGLNGAILSYDLNATLTNNSERVNGVAAFAGATSDVATSHRAVMMSMTDPNAIVKTPALGFYANAPARMTDDGAGNLTKFDMSTINNNDRNDTAMTLAIGTAVKANAGNDTLTGISWGRWDGGSMDVTKRATGALTATPLAGSLHWIAGPAETAAVTLPVSGTFAYTFAGGTAPTDNLGNAGTLNSATLSANFTAQTVDVGVSATVAGATLNATATGAPIIQRTAFYADSQAFSAGAPGKLTVTCTGTCGTSQQGTVIGAFTGAGAKGAMMNYGLQNTGSTSTQVISGVAAFHR